MKINRKRYGMKRRSSGGQAILEYIIIIALVAVAALTVLGLFGDVFDDRLLAVCLGITYSVAVHALELGVQHRTKVKLLFAHVYPPDT